MLANDQILFAPSFSGIAEAFRPSLADAEGAVFSMISNAFEKITSILPDDSVVSHTLDQELLVLKIRTSADVSQLLDDQWVALYHYGLTNVEGYPAGIPGYRLTFNLGSSVALHANPLDLSQRLLLGSQVARLPNPTVGSALRLRLTDDPGLFLYQAQALKTLGYILDIHTGEYVLGENTITHPTIESVLSRYTIEEMDPALNLYYHMLPDDGRWLKMVAHREVTTEVNHGHILTRVSTTEPAEA